MTKHQKSLNSFKASSTFLTCFLQSLENAPGGWNALLYSLNKSPKNVNHINDDQNIVKTSATFMVTASAFGIPVTKDNVYFTHEAYTNCNDNTSGKIKTKFDEIKGQEQNEEHVTISSATGNYLQKKLRSEFDTTSRPVKRIGNILDQKIKGNVAYTAKELINYWHRNRRN